MSSKENAGFEAQSGHSGLESLAGKGSQEARRITNPERVIPKKLFTLKEAGVYLGRSTWSIRSLCWNGHLAYIQDGRKFYVSIDDMDLYIKAHRVKNDPE